MEIEVNGVDVHFDTEATAESVMAFMPDVVICATGVSPGRLPVPGIDLSFVVSAKDVLEKRVTVGDSVVIVGGGVIGCETAELLLEQGKHVEIVEMTDTLASRMVEPG